jgi:long-chain acyl-CoA synthetase
MNLATAFAAAADAHAAKTAVYWGPSELTYADLRRLANNVTAHLRSSLEVKPGDRVGLWMRNCPEFLHALFGILQTGAVVVPINNNLKPPEVQFLVEDAGMDLLVTDETLRAAAESLLVKRPSLRLLFAETFASFPENPHPAIADCGEDDLAVIVYTSGTTGKPRGAMLSHGNLLHNVASCREVLCTVDADRFAVLLPMFHSYMLTVGLLLPLTVGGSIVLVRSLHPPRNVLQEILQRQATVLPAIPQFYRSMLASPLQPPLPIRLCVSGAAPLPVQVLRDFEAKFGIPLIEGYGLSEASPVVCKNPLNSHRKPGSIGIPIPNVEVSIQDETGRQLPPQAIGELCVRGGNVMLGYWNQPEETAKVKRNGWLLTGDIGYQDADGYFFITDRKKDMLLVNGINVYPREIEEVLYQFAGVAEAAVIGIPDPRRGEQPLAYVAPAPGTTVNEKELLAFLKQRLADHKVPRRIRFVEALPRNTTGKILKTTLRQMATAPEQPPA